MNTKMKRRIKRRDFLKQSLLTATAIPAASRTILAAPDDSARMNLKSLAEVDPAAVQKFVATLRGEVLRPGDQGYEAACRFWNGHVLKRPGLIVRCSDVEDIATSVKFARDEEVLLAVRGGGHTRNSSCDGGLLVNLSGLKGVSVDPVKRIARAQAGLRVGELDRATSEHSLATVLGECPSVGISGMTLGGGLGRLMGLHGSLCDNVVSAEVITAEGTMLRASASENSDLFWAIRGGGGNFGIVTGFEYRLHRVGPVLSGTLRYPVSSARAVLRFMREYMETAPSGLDVVIEIGSRVLQYAPDASEPIVVINVCCSGDLRAAERAIRPLRRFQKPTSDTIQRMSYFVAQVQGDIRPFVEHASSGFAGYSRSGFLTGLSEEAIDRIMSFCERPPSSSWSLALDHYMHGEVLRPKESEMAFCLRQKGYSYRTTAFQPGSGPPEKAMAWVRGLTGALEPYSGGRMYMNYLTDQGEAGVRAAFADNYSRLAAIKKKYDPANLFQLNPNIKPAA